MRGSHVAAAAAILALVVPGTLQAQQGGLRDRDPVLTAAKRIATDLQKATAHYGPFYLLSSIQLSDIGYNDQFYAPTGDQAQSVSVGLSAPQRLYFVPRKKTVYSLEFVPQYSWVERVEDTRDPETPDDDVTVREGQHGYRARLDAQYLFNHLYLDLYVETTDQIQANTGEINRLFTERRNEGGIAGEIKYSSRTSTTFHIARRDITHPRGGRLQPIDVPIDLLDRQETNARAAFIHKTFPLTSLTFAAEGSDYSFDRATYKDGRRSYFAPGFLFDNGRTSWRLEVGRGTLRFDQRGQHTFEGVLGNTALSRRLGDKWTVTFGAARDVDFSIFGPNNFYTADRANLGIEYAMTRRLSLRSTNFGGRDQYDLPVEGVLRRDTTRYNAVGWLYSWRKLRGGFDVGYYERSSNFATADEEDGIRYVIHLSFSP